MTKSIANWKFGNIELLNVDIHTCTTCNSIPSHPIMFGSILDVHKLWVLTPPPQLMLTIRERIFYDFHPNQLWLIGECTCSCGDFHEGGLFG